MDPNTIVGLNHACKNVGKDLLVRTQDSEIGGIFVFRYKDVNSEMVLKDL
jgi:hypothetical protein